ncbi:hypothetical protein [Paenarthrobacter aurescens]|uniref:hypothetical protein n=1 Tax=Paenarthrobacter aurescens TaxID=43663 RepID=UPI00131F30CF|nr:hypothetical protein [Paenarthrobacter aurescens]
MKREDEVPVDATECSSVDAGDADSGLLRAEAEAAAGTGARWRKVPAVNDAALQGVFDGFARTVGALSRAGVVHDDT